MNVDRRHDRYVGARPYEDTEIDLQLFFGRDMETNELLNRVMGNQVLLVFGKSGLGKTSLLQAGLFPKLREQHLLPLPIRLNRTDLEPMALFSEAIAGICAQVGIDYSAGSGDTLWEFFKTALFWRDEVLATPVLVLDQFEEIFTQQSIVARRTIARQLGELIDAGLPQNIRSRLQAGEKLPYSEKPPAVKIILSLREDYLGALQELCGEMPRIWENRFRLLPLNEEQARESVVKPGALPQGQTFSIRPFHYEKSAVEELVGFLAGKTGEIEPFQLQILCRQIEQRVAEVQAKGRLDVHVDQEFLGGRTRMEAILQGFYDDAMRQLPSWLRQVRARKLCEQGLLDPRGYRRILEENDISRRYHIGAVDLQVLVEKRLLRKEERAELSYYELSHDSLVQPVLGSERKRRARRRRHLWIYLAAFFILSLFLAKKQYDQYEVRKAIEQLQVTADTYEFEGDKLRADGDLAGASAQYRRILTIFNALAKMDSAEYPTQRLLAREYEKIGDKLSGSNDRAGALDAYQQSLKIYEGLRESNPGDILQLEKIAPIHVKIGDILVAIGDLRGAEEAYRQDLKISSELVAKDPGNSNRLRDLAGSYSKLGNVLKASGDLMGAEKAFQQDLEISSELVAKDPRNSNRQGDLGVSYGKVGDVRMASGDLKGAEETFQQYLKKFSELVDEDPSNSDWQRELAVSYGKVGDVRMASGDLKGAEKAFQQDLKISSELVAKDPRNSNRQRDLAVSYRKVGGFLRAKGDLGKAIDAYDESLKIVSLLAERDPGNVKWQLDLAATSAGLTASLRKSGISGAEDRTRMLSEQALDSLRRLQEAGRLPGDCSYWRDSVDFGKPMLRCQEWLQILEQELTTQDEKK